MQNGSSSICEKDVMPKRPIDSTHEIPENILQQNNRRMVSRKIEVLSKSWINYTTIILFLVLVRVYYQSKNIEKLLDAGKSVVIEQYSQTIKALNDINIYFGIFANVMYRLVVKCMLNLLDMLETLTDKLVSIVNRVLLRNISSLYGIISCLLSRGLDMHANMKIKYTVNFNNVKIRILDEANKQIKIPMFTPEEINIDCIDECFTYLRLLNTKIFWVACVIILTLIVLTNIFFFAKDLRLKFKNEKIAKKYSKIFLSGKEERVDIIRVLHDMLDEYKSPTYHNICKKYINKLFKSEKNRESAVFFVKYVNHAPSIFCILVGLTGLLVSVIEFTILRFFEIYLKSRLGVIVRLVGDVIVEDIGNIFFTTYKSILDKLCSLRLTEIEFHVDMKGFVEPMESLTVAVSRILDPIIGLVKIDGVIKCIKHALPIKTIMLELMKEINTCFQKGICFLPDTLKPHEFISQVGPILKSNILSDKVDFHPIILRLEEVFIHDMIISFIILIYGLLIIAQGVIILYVMRRKKVGRNSHE